MLTKAISQVNKWGPQNIQDYCEKLTSPYIKELKELGVQIEADEYRGRHLFGLRLPNHMDMEEIKKQFAERKIFVSIRGNSIRISPNLYNLESDLERLVDSFKVMDRA